MTLNEEEKQNREDDVVYRNETKRSKTKKTVFSKGHTIFWCQYNMLFLVGVVRYNFSCVGGFANKRESCTYDSVYDLHREKRTKNTLNIMFFGENVSVPLYLCMLFFVEI